MAKVKDWISAFRLRTLPLALSCIFMGSFLAYDQGTFDWSIFVLSITTTILLQILSNLSNDYGDSIHGADSNIRKGPARLVQQGKITSGQMKSGMIICAILAFLSGILLLYRSLAENIIVLIVFIFLGLAAIAAAIKYTSGSNPYGYKGYGDIAVLVFFGLVGVIGTYFLQVKNIQMDIILPALSCGLFATGVLNVNNIRDINSDKEAGKISIPVRLGRDKAIIYHWILLVSGIVSDFVYVFFNYQGYWQFLFLVTTPLFLKNAKAVSNKVDANELDPYLKQLAISTLLFVVTFGIGLILS